MSVFEVPAAAFMEDPEIQAFADSVGRFFQRAAPPERVARWRAAGQVERQFWREAGQAGLLGVSVPTEYGGAGGDFRHDIVVFEQSQRHGLDGFAVALHNVIILPYILAHGTEEQRRRWLPKLVSGERVSAIAMSEPNSGSDLQAIRTSAVKQGDSYRLNGSKIFISNGQIADLIVVVAKTDPAAAHKGISLLVIETDEAQGFSRGRKLDKIGLDAQDTSELFFVDVKVPEGNLLGGEEGRGFAQLMKELPRERLIMALGGVISMELALQTTIEYVKNRKAFGKQVIEFQNTQFKLAECRAQATVAKVFVNDCIAKVLQGKLDNTLSAIAKMWVTDVECKVIDECLQLHGGYGYINDYPIARLFCNSRAQRIAGGTNEIMKVVIARSL